MEDNSSYASYLPSVLWRPDPPDETPPGRVPLGPLLRIFEKVLTGIPDDVVLIHGDHAHEAITDQVAELHRVFDPWAVPEPLLSWLASCVDLEFPTLQGSQLWDEYQRRRATALIAQIYRQRGLKTGLNRYLDLYSSAQVAPRVVIDDGGRLVRVRPDNAAAAAVAGLVTRGPVLAADRSLLAEGLARPQCVARGPDGSVFAADAPLPLETPLVGFRPRVWRFSATGAYQHAAGATAPQPVAGASLAPQDVCALAVAPAGGGRPETLYVLERSGLLFGVPAPYETATAAQVGDLRVPGRPFVPAAMALDPAAGTLVVLNKGSGLGTPNPPQVLVVTPAPFAVARTALTSVIEPLSLLVQDDGSLLVGDGREQDPASAAQWPANVVRVVRTATPWTERALLDPVNPLRAPTGIARTADGTLYVLDVGLKPLEPFSADPFVCPAADPAAVFQLRESGGSAIATRITGPGSFVYPLGLVAAGPDLVVADKGQFDPEQPSWSRLQPYEFDVVIHFPTDRVPTDETERMQVLSRVVGDITSVVDAQKPAHTVWNLVTRF
jgi:phage tail-like protein